MLQITDEISLEDSEIVVKFVRSGGPGGQHVNKVATAVQLRFDAAGSSSLPDDVRERLTELAGNRMSDDGERHAADGSRGRLTKGAPP
jgi:ribosome-associated protein